MTKSVPKEAIAKTTLRLPKALIDAAKHCAIDQGVDLQTIAKLAFEQYLSQKGGRKA